MLSIVPKDTTTACAQTVTRTSNPLAEKQAGPLGVLQFQHQPMLFTTLSCTHLSCIPKPPFFHCGVQVASGGANSSHGQVEILSLNRASPRLVKTLPLRAPVLCLEYVKEPCPSTEEAEKAQRAAKMGNIICVGLQDGRSVLQLWVGVFLLCLCSA